MQSSQTGLDADWVYLPIKKIEKVHYEGLVYNLETTSQNYCSDGIVNHNCSLGHVGTCAALLPEAMRFARGKDGLADPEVLDRVTSCLTELNAMERIDLRPEMMVKLPEWERELALKVSETSRSIRHGLEGMRTADDLEKVAATAQSLGKDVGRAYFTAKLKNFTPQEISNIQERAKQKAAPNAKIMEAIEQGITPEEAAEAEEPVGTSALRSLEDDAYRLSRTR